MCGPEENRTLHNLLARETRQPWYMQALLKLLLSSQTKGGINHNKINGLV